MKKKIALLLACVMAFGIAVGGTLAWLTATDDPVVNTFAPSTINIDLTETFNKDTDGKDGNDTWEKKMVPGDTLAKDPKVTVGAGSEACWLFVAVTESTNLDTFITYQVATGDGKWTQLSGYENIYYRNVTTEDIGKDFYILQGNDEYQNGCVTVNTSVTKANMETIKETSAQPTLTFNACAVQSAHLETVAKAWEQADATFKTLAIATPANP